MFLPLVISTVVLQTIAKGLAEEIPTLAQNFSVETFVYAKTKVTWSFRCSWQHWKAMWLSGSTEVPLDVWPDY